MSLAFIIKFLKNWVRFQSLFVFIGLAICFVSCGTRYELPDDPPPITQRVNPSSIRLALVLGGGGARGMAHVGVLEELEQANIPIDVIVGCSAGSIVGALYADCPKASYIREVLHPLRKWDILDINLWYARYGLVQGRSLCQLLKTRLSCHYFHELKIPLYVVATDLVAGELVCFSTGPLIPAVHASSAIPFIFSPVLYCGRLLVDGGVADPVPVAIARQLEADIIVAVDLKELLPKTCPTNLLGVAKRAAEIKFLLQSESCVREADVIIQPELCEVGLFDDKSHDLTYEAGRLAARRAIPDILELLERRSQNQEFDLTIPILNDLCH